MNGLLLRFSVRKETKMEISTQQSPQVIRLRCNYGLIIQQIITANGDWQPVDPQALAGLSKATKQKSLWQAATQRGIKIQTTFQVDGFLYARLITAVGQ
jgi:hypothetical protein